jgi:hypothetical protein
MVGTKVEHTVVVGPTVESGNGLMNFMAEVDVRRG